MNLFFLTTFNYLTHYAHLLHGLFLARQFHVLSEEKFQFIVHSAHGEQVVGFEDNIASLFGCWSRLWGKLYAQLLGMFCWLFGSSLFKSVSRGLYTIFL